MRIAFYTLGCKVNQYETELLRDEFVRSGYEIASDDQKADIYVINSCCVTAEGERKTRQAVSRYRRLNNEAVIALIGCYSQVFSEKARQTGADIILGTGEKDKLQEYLNLFFATGEAVIKTDFADNRDIKSTIKDGFFGERTRAFIKIQDGCDRYCSYCIIPYARGEIRSKPLELLIQEAQRLAENGYKELVLTGINLLSYGIGKDYNICDAVEGIAEIDSISRIRLGSIEPDLISFDMIDRLGKTAKLCPHFHLSLQSGSNKTLKRMNRNYTTEYYTELVEYIRKRFDNPAITTDIMVGFAGETDEEFSESYKYAEKIGFARIHVFSYSVREGTAAAKMPGHISKQIKQKRSRQMLELANKLTGSFLNRQLNREFPVLLESRVKNNIYEGLTPNYVNVKVKSFTDIRGRILNVKATGIDGENCTGELIG